MSKSNTTPSVLAFERNLDISDAFLRNVIAKIKIRLKKPLKFVKSPFAARFLIVLKMLLRMIQPN